jgi:hypothetical protein
MSNWDYVFTYDDTAASWLGDQGCPAPSVSQGNRLPTTAELTQAFADLANAEHIVIDSFDWESPEATPDEAFRLKGDCRVALTRLRSLSAQCGQLWFYPDTGEPAIVVDPGLDPAETERLHTASLEEEDSWQFFYKSMYGATGKR